MSVDFWREAEAAMHAARVLTAAWVLLTQAQLAVAAADFAPSGVLAWGRPAGLVPVQPDGPRRLLSPSAVRVYATLQIVVALTLALAPSPPVAIACLFVLIVCQICFTILVGEWFIDGSDKIAMIVMVGTLIATWGLGLADHGLVLAGVLLVGGQLSLSYAVAGVSKIAVPGWRDGTRLRAIMCTQAWGVRTSGALMTLPGVALAASWAVILIEALFPLALFAPEPALWAAMAAMLAFHIATAVIMGLNRFPWAFVAAYPACFLLGRLIATATSG